MKEYAVISPLKLGQSILQVGSTVTESDMVADQAESLIALGVIELKQTQAQATKKSKEKTAD